MDFGQLMSRVIDGLTAEWETPVDRPYTINTLIDDLNAIANEHGDIDVFDGNLRAFRASHVELVKVDDWDNATQTPDGEIPGVAFAFSLGRRI